MVCVTFIIIKKYRKGSVEEFKQQEEFNQKMLATIPAKSLSSTLALNGAVSLDIEQEATIIDLILHSSLLGFKFYKNHTYHPAEG